MFCFRPQGYLAALLTISLTVPMTWSLASASTARGRQPLTKAPTTSGSESSRSGSQKRLDKNAYGSLPLSFAANRGQANSAATFVAAGNGYGLFLTDRGPVLSLSKTTAKNETKESAAKSSAVISFELVGSRGPARIQGIDQLPGKANYFSGNDSTKWLKGVPTYAKVEYAAVYPGIDVIYYGNQQQLEYDFLVGAGKDPSRIAFEVKGIEGATINPAGDLELQTRGGDLALAKPFAYQMVNGVRRSVDAGYRINANVVSFQLGAYDRKLPLIIDPVLAYSSFYGGSLGEQAYGIAVDGQGNAYITGRTVSYDLPVVGGVQSTKGSADNFLDVFVAKINPTGNSLIYSTYLGGSADDTGRAIKVDDQGNAYVAGTSQSTNFPSTVGSLQPAKSALTDGFVAKLNAAGAALIYSTFVGGDDADDIFGLAISADGRATVAGTTASSRFSTNTFPTARGGSPVYRSTDSANSWSIRGNGLGANAVNTFAIENSNPNNIYAGTDAGLYKSVDAGATWTLLANGIPASYIYAVVIDPSNSSIVYVTDGLNLYKSINSGASFDLKKQNLFAQCLAIDPAATDTIYAGTSIGFFKTTDGGATWNEVVYGPNGPAGQLVTKVIIDPTDHTKVYVGTGSFGVFRTNSGNGWISLNNGALTPTAVTALAIDPVNPLVLYAGIGDFPDLVKTTNGGTSWTSAAITYTTGSTVNYVQVNDLSIDRTNSNIVYAATSAGIFKTTDGGANWVQSNTGLTRLNANAVIIDPTNATNIFAGTLVGIDAFAARLNAAGTALEFVRNFGGDSSDRALAVALDASNNVYLTGATGSTNFPVTNPVQTALAGDGDAFVAKLDSSGNSFVYSTFLGGNSADQANGIAVRNGAAYIVGQTYSSNFPLINPLKSTLAANDADAFVTKVNDTGSAFDFSTFLGGNGEDNALGVTLDSAGNIYLAGSTASADFPTQSPAQTNIGGGLDAFISELNPAGNQIVFSTFLGGSSSDAANGIAVDGLGNTYVTGATSSNNFPTVNPYQAIRKGNDAFFAKINSASSLASNIQFSQATYQIGESGPGVSVVVTRTGFSAGEANVNYTTSDSTTNSNCSAVSGNASSKCDYESSFGTVHFAAGETSRTIYIPIVDDSYAEGNEVFTISLQNPTDASLGQPATATITIVDNDSVNGANPIDDPHFFVRQHYIDFLNREPDSDGLAFWSNQITECQQPGATCNAQVRRINVSAAFFLSIEFQETGYLVERMYKVAYGDATGTSNFGPTHTLAVPVIRFNEFLPDSQAIAKGLVVGQPGWEQVLDNNKVAFSQAFVQRSRFSTSYSALLTPAQFVDQLFAHAGVTPTTAERDAAINEFGGALTSADIAARARALRSVAESDSLNQIEKRRAFVLMQYFGYLRRNPNDPQDTDYSGYDFWLTKLNDFNGNYIQAEMVKAFLDSDEYRHRFGP